MAKEFIVLNSSTDTIFFTVNSAFWFPITTGQQLVTGVSAWLGASAQENAAIQSGAVIEELRSFSFPTGLDATSMLNTLVQYWTNRNAQLGGIGPGAFAGAYFDPQGGGLIIPPPK